MAYSFPRCDLLCSYGLSLHYELRQVDIILRGIPITGVPFFIAYCLWEYYLLSSLNIFYFFGWVY